MGLTFGAPVVAFESPGEAMTARRLHLPSPVSQTPPEFFLVILIHVGLKPSLQHITHVYHTADVCPIFIYDHKYYTAHTVCNSQLRWAHVTALVPGALSEATPWRLSVIWGK